VATTPLAAVMLMNSRREGLIVIQIFSPTSLAPVINPQ
jgi:hypothetical protein